LCDISDLLHYRIVTPAEGLGPFGGLAILS